MRNVFRLVGLTMMYPFTWFVLFRGIHRKSF